MGSMDRVKVLAVAFTLHSLISYIYKCNAISGKFITLDGEFTMYNSISNNYKIAQVLQIRNALIAAVLLIGVLIFLLAEQAQASPTEQGSESTKQITGQVTWANGAPAPGIRVEASRRSSGQQNEWYPTYSDPNGYYTLTVPSGRWQIDFDAIVQYDLERGDFASQSTAAVLILNERWYSPDLPQTVAFGDDELTETHELDIRLRWVNSQIFNIDGPADAQDATISGVILRTDTGEPVIDGSIVFRNSANKNDSRVVNVGEDGQFWVPVRSGTTWQVKATWSQNYEEPSYPVAWTGVVEVTESGETELTIGGTAELDTTINGIILRTDTGEPVIDGHVSLVNDADGYYYGSLDVDESGRFQAVVQSGTTWNVSARWGQNFDTVLYPVSWKGVVEVAEPGEMEFTIGGVVEMNEAAFLPVVIR